MSSSYESPDPVEAHEDRMELLYARLADACPGGIDPLIWDEIIDPEYEA